LLSHALLIGSAHGGGQAGAPGPAGGAPIGLDSRSLQCMGCHDGSIAESDNMRVTNPSLFGQPGSGGGPSIGQTHPVGVDYASAALARREFESSGSLRRGAVRLVEGKVGCTSCHSPYSKNARLLVVSNAGSALCLRCHHL